ncbi:MAG TPA: peptidoglycan-binding domain-containing protein [Chthoniobacterales bacterium]|nr:peptidoglycan-binding domain-containing protein [Chthoniobacterales bacterium]
MNKFLTSICVLALVASPVWAEDQDQAKHNRSRPQNAPPPPQRHVNVAPKPVTPRVQPNFSANNQFQNRTKPSIAPRTYVPRTYTPRPQVQAQTQTSTVTGADLDAPRSTLRTNPNTIYPRWQNRTRERNPNVVIPQPSATPVTTAQNNPTVPNREWRNRTTTNNNNQNRNWQNNNWRNHNWRNNNSGTVWTFDQARRHHRRDRHDRSWWRSHYSRIALFAGGYYYWNSGYWYPAYGYDPYYSSYTYDEPIYGYNDLPPGQVIANVQSALQEQGYYQDAVDGLIGPRTRAALSAFQRDQGLPITAAIDGPTLQALGLY